MQMVLQVLATVAAILAPLSTIIGLVQSRGWLTAFGSVVVLILCGVAIWVLHTRRRMAAVSVVIDGNSIDSVSAANLRRRIDRNLMIQTAEHTATIDGPDLQIAWRYTGFCRARSATTMEFSIDSSTSTPFSQLDCSAFDLRHDPNKQHPIRPLLIGPDGISKKVAVPFLSPLSLNQPFDLALQCRLPMTYSPGTCHYSSSLSFDQQRVGHYAVSLKFLRTRPSWVRVYEIDSAGRPRLLKNLHPAAENDGILEYRDVMANAPARSIRVYRFHLDAL